jgi:hypothetical protein
MIEVKLKGKTYNVPTVWDEITTEQYIKLNNLITMFQDEEGNMVVEDDVLFPRIVEVISKIKRDEVNNLEFFDVLKMQKAMVFLHTAPITPTKMLSVFRYKNYLIKIKKFDRLTFGEFADTQHLKSLGIDSTVKAIANIVDIYEAKNIKKFKFKERKLDLSVDDKEKIIGSIPCTQFSNITFFLLNGQRRFMKNLVRYMEVRALRLNWNTTLQAAGVIISGLWIWLTKRPLKSKMQSN